MLSELNSYILEEHRKDKGWLKSEPKKKTVTLNLSDLDSYMIDCFGLHQAIIGKLNGLYRQTLHKDFEPTAENIEKWFSLLSAQLEDKTKCY